MPIRRRCPEKPQDRQQAMNGKETITPPLRNPQACHKDKKPELRTYGELV